MQFGNYLLYIPKRSLTIGTGNGNKEANQVQEYLQKTCWLSFSFLANGAARGNAYQILHAIKLGSILHLCTGNLIWNCAQNLQNNSEELDLEN